LNLIEEKAWKRLKRNRSAVFGGLVILLASLLAIFAYHIAPDQTPSANDQILQLETHPPGFSIEVLKIRRQKELADEGGFFSGWGGFHSSYQPVPVLKYSFSGDSMTFLEYRGKGFAPLRQTLSIHQVVYAEDRKYVPPAEQLKMHQEIKQRLIERRTYWLGTDKFGRDILSRLLIGIRISLSVGFVSVFISLILGITAGALAGYFRGWIDQTVNWVMNVFWAIPTILLAMCLYISAGNWIENKLLLIFIAVGLTMWVDVARIVRGQFLLVTELEYITAARSLGFSHFRTIFKHVLPNTLAPVIVVACANFANAILVESGLSYIGLGIQPPAPSWGSMLNEYKGFIDTDKAYLALFPGLAIMFMVLAFNLIGNGLRDALDVKGKTES
jgi:peptide/nickel transport system permease protein